MLFYLYILQTKTTKKYYIGSSEHPEVRLHYHNTIEKGYTSRYRPWEIIYTKEYESKALAQQAERKVKSWKSKRMIEKLIAGEIQL